MKVPAHLLDATKGLPLQHRAYILATAHHETGGTFKPVREAFGKTDGETINRLERAWQAGKMPQVTIPYWNPDASGRAWFGRGYVQLTHRANYAAAAKALGVDLLGNPSLALDEKVAAQILVRGMVNGWFTGKRLSDFTDYVQMRKVVNGTDRAEKIARLAVGYEDQLRNVSTPSRWALLLDLLKGVFQWMTKARKS